MSAVRPEQLLVARVEESPVAEHPAGLDAKLWEATGAELVDAGAVQVTVRVGVPEFEAIDALTAVGAAGALIAVAETVAVRALSAAELYEATLKS